MARADAVDQAGSGDSDGAVEQSALSQAQINRLIELNVFVFQAFVDAESMWEVVTNCPERLVSLRVSLGKLNQYDQEIQTIMQGVGSSSYLSFSQFVHRYSQAIPGMWAYVQLSYHKQACETGNNDYIVLLRGELYNYLKFAADAMLTFLEQQPWRTFLDVINGMIGVTVAVLGSTASSEGDVYYHASPLPLLSTFYVRFITQLMNMDALLVQYKWEGSKHWQEKITTGIETFLAYVKEQPELSALFSRTYKVGCFQNLYAQGKIDEALVMLVELTDSEHPLITASDIVQVDLMSPIFNEVNIRIQILLAEFVASGRKFFPMETLFQQHFPRLSHCVQRLVDRLNEFNDRHCFTGNPTTQMWLQSIVRQSLLVFENLVVCVLKFSDAIIRPRNRLDVYQKVTDFYAQLLAIIEKTKQRYSEVINASIDFRAGEKLLALVAERKAMAETDRDEFDQARNDAAIMRKLRLQQQKKHKSKNRPRRRENSAEIEGVGEGCSTAVKANRSGDDDNLAAEIVELGEGGSSAVKTEGGDEANNPTTEIEGSSDHSEHYLLRIKAADTCIAKGNYHSAAALFDELESIAETKHDLESICEFFFRSIRCYCQIFERGLHANDMELAEGIHELKERLFQFRDKQRLAFDKENNEDVQTFYLLLDRVCQLKSNLTKKITDKFLVKRREKNHALGNRVFESSNVASSCRARSGGNQRRGNRNPRETPTDIARKELEAFCLKQFEANDTLMKHLSDLENYKSQRAAPSRRKKSKSRSRKKLPSSLDWPVMFAELFCNGTALISFKSLDAKKVLLTVLPFLRSVIFNETPDSRAYHCFLLEQLLEIDHIALLISKQQVKVRLLALLIWPILPNRFSEPSQDADLDRSIHEYLVSHPIIGELADSATLFSVAAQLSRQIAMLRQGASLDFLGDLEDMVIPLAEEGPSTSATAVNAIVSGAGVYAGLGETVTREDANIDAPNIDAEVVASSP